MNHAHEKKIHRYGFCVAKIRFPYWQTITDTVSVLASTLKDTDSVLVRLSTDTVSVHLLCLPRGKALGCSALDLLLLIFQHEIQRAVRQPYEIGQGERTDKLPGTSDQKLTHGPGRI